MTTNEFLNEFLFLNFSRYPAVRPKIVCKDGFEVSVQASEFHYCHPRASTNPMLYDQVELGFPSEAVPEWLEYAEEQYDPTDTVYGYVPVELVDAALEKHGGIDLSKTKEKYIQHMASLDGATEAEHYKAFLKIFRRLGAE